MSILKIHCIQSFQWTILLIMLKLNNILDKWILVNSTDKSLLLLNRRNDIWVLLIPKIDWYLKFLVWGANWLWSLKSCNIQLHFLDNTQLCIVIRTWSVSKSSKSNNFTICRNSCHFLCSSFLYVFKVKF